MNENPQAGSEMAAELAALVDTLIPGDERFPPASQAGVQWALATRWRGGPGATKVEELLSRIVDCCGSLQNLDSPERENCVIAFEKRHGALFSELRRLTYLSYYEAPPVVAILQQIGHQYRAAPQPEGYHLARSEIDNTGARHKRGHYVRTQAVVRVDLSTLKHLDER